MQFLEGFDRITSAVKCLVDTPDRDIILFKTQIDTICR